LPIFLSRGNIEVSPTDCLLCLEQIFQELGADLTHVSGLKNEEEMRRYCDAIPGPKMYNNVSAGHPMPIQADNTEIDI